MQKNQASLGSFASVTVTHKSVGAIINRPFCRGAARANTVRPYDFFFHSNTSRITTSNASNIYTYGVINSEKDISGTARTCA